MQGTKWPTSSVISVKFAPTGKGHQWQKATFGGHGIRSFMGPLTARLSGLWAWMAVLGVGAFGPRPCAGDYWMYIGTYTTGTSRGIYKVDVNVETLSVGKPELVAELRNPSFLAIHPSGQFLYAVGELGEFQGKRVGAVSALAIEPGSGRLRLINQQSSGGAGPCHLVVDPSGRWVLVANYSGGTTSVLPIAADGALGPPVSIQEHSGHSIHPTRQRQPHPHQVWIAEGTDLVLVPDLGTDHVVLYRLNPKTGQLVANTPSAVNVPPGSGPRHLAFAPGNEFLFVLNELTSTVSLFRCHEAVPKELLATVSALPADFRGENTAAEIAVHPSGKTVLTSNRGHDSIALFRFDHPSATLELIGHVPSGGKTPRHFALDPTGKFLFSANQNSDLIAVYHFGNVEGKLEDTGVRIEVGAPVCLVFQERF